MLARQSGRCSWGLAVDVAFARSLRLEYGFTCGVSGNKQHVFICSRESHLGLLKPPGSPQEQVCSAGVKMKKKEIKNIALFRNQLGSTI